MGLLKRRIIEAMEPTEYELARRWIAVGERLPEWGTSVLMFHRVTDADGTPSCIGYDGNGGLIAVAELQRIEGQNLWTSEYGDAKPTHWMPLPEPPAPVA